MLDEAARSLHPNPHLFTTMPKHIEREVTLMSPDWTLVIRPGGGPRGQPTVPIAPFIQNVYAYGRPNGVSTDVETGMTQRQNSAEDFCLYRNYSTLEHHSERICDKYFI